jgi:hypothetical protein
MQRWYATLHGDGEMACPYCRQRNAEPVPAPSEGTTVVTSLLSRRYENWNQPQIPTHTTHTHTHTHTHTPNTNPHTQRPGRNGVSPLIAEVCTIYHKNRHNYTE